MAGDAGGKQVGSVHVDSPKLSQALDGVVDGLKVLGEACRGDEVVDLAVLLDNLPDAGFDGPGIGDIGIVGADFGNSRKRGTILALLPISLAQAVV